MSNNDSAGPLAGIRVVDLTTVIMGPYATATLADLGAEVIKVEPLGGDMTRFIGPSRTRGMSAMTLNMQRGKRSIAIDIATPAGRAVLDDLVRDADVLVTNLRPRSRERLGLTEERLLGVNPRLVLCTAQAYAANSARRDEPAYDDIVQAASGSAMISARIDGIPRYAPSVIADKVTGLNLVIAILAALHERDTRGSGQSVDVAMVDTMIAFNMVEHLNGHTFDPVEDEFGWTRILVAERKPHRTADGWICLMPYSMANWLDFFAAIGRDDLTTDPRFESVDGRHRHMGFLLSLVDEATPSRSTQDWLNWCNQHDVPAAELLDLSHVHEDPYALEERLLERRDHPSEGSYFRARTPMTFSKTPTVDVSPAPLVGEQSDEILKEHGYDDSQVGELMNQGIVR